MNYRERFLKLNQYSDSKLTKIELLNSKLSELVNFEKKP